MAADSKSEARREARSVVNQWAVKFAAIAWIPGSHYAMSGADTIMVTELALLFDVDMDKATLAGVFTSVAAPLIGSKLAHTALDLVPGVGWVAKSAVAAGVTKKIGDGLIDYFDDHSPLPEY